MAELSGSLQRCHIAEQYAPTLTIEQQYSVPDRLMQSKDEEVMMSALLHVTVSDVLQVAVGVKGKSTVTALT